MATRYLILRTTRDLADPGDFSAAGLRRSLERGETEVTVEVADGHETDIGRLREDPRNAAVVDAGILLSLVAPEASSAASAAGFVRAGNLQLTNGLLAVGADTTPFSGQGVTVAVLDTGIDATHPAFVGKVLAKRDFTDAGSAPDDVTDKDGHGTHCAATICGVVTDGVRVGVAPGVAKLCVGKVLGPKGGDLETLTRGLFWAAVEEKAAVISMSLGYDLPGNTARLIERGVSPALAANAAMRQQGDILKTISTLRIFLEVQNPNLVIVAASGNESRRPAFVLDAGLPGAELFPVGAVGLKDGKWSVAAFSNGRAQLVAPGVDVISAAVGGGWRSLSGTSMATPHVAGVAALWVEKLRADNTLIPGATVSALKANARRQVVTDQDFNAVGAGMVRCPQ